MSTNFETDLDDDDDDSSSSSSPSSIRQRRFLLNGQDYVFDSDRPDYLYPQADESSQKRAPAQNQGTATKSRVAAGMRYAGIGKRKFNVRSRVDAGMRYMGIGKRQL